MSKPFTPWAYQTEAIKWLLQNSNAGLFFDPGLGKTACVLATVLMLRQRGMMRRALVVSTRRVIHDVWPVEREEWTDFHPLRVSVLHGAKKDLLLNTTAKDADICCVTQDGLQWLCDPAFNRINIIDPDVLIVDESSFFRHTSSKRFQTLKALLPRFKRRIILTGTPAPRNYEDLFPQIFILDQGGALGRYITHYRSRYFYDAGYGYPDWKLRPGADVEINQRIKPLVLRGDQVDHLEMPLLVYNTIKVDLPAPARQRYDHLESAFYEEIEGHDILAPTSAVLSNKLRQVANGFVYDTNHDAVDLHDVKIEALQGLLSELQGNPALVLYEYNHDLARLKAALTTNGMVPPFIGEGTTDKQASSYIADFNAGKIPVLLAHPASAGHGLNMQKAAQHVIWFGPTWNLEWFIQANHRVWRQGNTHDRVFVHFIVARDTIEERVAKVLSDKEQTQRALLDALKRPAPEKAAA
jgi:hypothetical protein